MTEASSGTVRYEVVDGVATIALNRPDAMNGLDIATKEALLDAVREAAQDDAVRCVVLTGSGRAFCVGQDLKEHIKILESSDTESLFTTVEEHRQRNVALVEKYIGTHHDPLAIGRAHTPALKPEQLGRRAQVDQRHADAADPRAP